MTSTSTSNPFITQNAELTNDTKPASDNGGEQTTSAGHPSKARGSSLWDQWMSQTGWFGPLLPPEDPQKLEEKQRQAEEQRRLEKERSVHSWRPSQDEASTSTSPTKKGGASRPSLMKRLSSAVELKWWAADAPAPEDSTQVEEEDLQHPRSSSEATRSRRSGSGSLQGSRNRARTGSSSLQPMAEQDDSGEDFEQPQANGRASQEIQMR